MGFSENLEFIRRRIAEACERSGRDPSEISLMAVTKTQPPDVVAEAAKHGLTLFGENKVQEAKAKIPLCPGKLRWHMIGHLQSNKAKDAVGLFEMIQSVDSRDLACEINKRAEQAAVRLPILIEVNIVGEASKFGYKPEAMLRDFQEINNLPRVEIHGLMTIPPWTPVAEKARPVFRRLRELRDQCSDMLGAPLPVLSMGMTGDFEVAIEEGSTMVRIGTALFGERTKPLKG